jgi:putative hemolysin
MSEIALISARKSRLESSAKKGIKVLKWRSIWLIHKQIPVDGSNGITLIGILTGIYSGDKITTVWRPSLRALQY